MHRWPIKQTDRLVGRRRPVLVIAMTLPCLLPTKNTFFLNLYFSIPVYHPSYLTSYYPNLPSTTSRGIFFFSSSSMPSDCAIVAPQKKTSSLFFCPCLLSVSPPSSLSHSRLDSMISFNVFIASRNQFIHADSAK